MKPLISKETELANHYHTRDQKIGTPQNRPTGNINYPPIMFITPTKPQINPILNGILKPLKITPQNCYYTQPPQYPYQGTQTPHKQQKQTKTTQKYLHEEINLINPETIILLGENIKPIFFTKNHKPGTILNIQNQIILTTHDLNTLHNNPHLINQTTHHIQQLKNLLLNTT